MEGGQQIWNLGNVYTSMDPTDVTRHPKLLDPGNRSFLTGVDIFDGSVLEWATQEELENALDPVRL